MDSHNRPLENEADQILITALAHRNAGQPVNTVDLPYRLASWALDDPQNTSLWFSADGKLLAWAIMQTPFWTIDLAIDPAVEQELVPQVLAWAGNRANEILPTRFGRSVWYTPVDEDQLSRRTLLEQAGFSFDPASAENSWTRVFMSRPARLGVDEFPLPYGFVIRPLKGMDEVPAYVKLHQSAFDTRNMTIGWRVRTLECPAYRPDLDLVIESPEGELVAFCIAWLDEATRTAQIEPLGSRKNFRRFALGRVILAHMLKKLQGYGLEQVVVETDLYRNTAHLLYQSLGFEDVHKVLMYSRGVESS